MNAGSLDIMLNQIPYHNRARVKEDISKLISTIKTLVPKIGQLIHNNGTESRLVLLAGTVPIYYQGVQYNIPVELFILEKYPQEPPKIYVRPTPNMTIKSNHRHVDMQGLVFLPYLHEWKYDSNLVGLVEITSNVFSIEPPLFSKPAASAATPVVTYPSYSSSSAMSSGAYGGNLGVSAYPASQLRPTAAAGMSASQYGGAIPAIAAVSSYNTGATISAMATPIAAVATPYNSSSSSSNNSGGYVSSGGSMSATVAAAVYSPPVTSATSLGAVNGVGSTYGMSAFGTTTSSSATTNTNTNTNTLNTTAAAAAAETQRLKEVRARNIAEITRRMREDLIISHDILRDELDVTFRSERYLKESHAAATQNIEDLKELISQLENGILTVSAKDAELSQWVAEQETTPPVDCEERLVPFDDLTAQVVKLNSELVTIDDAIYYLERALVSEQNHMDLSTKLKEIRKLSRQQFMCKAHLMKINGHMMQSMRVNTDAQCAIGPPQMAAATEGYRLQWRQPQPSPQGAVGMGPNNPQQQFQQQQQQHPQQQPRRSMSPSGRYYVYSHQSHLYQPQPQQSQQQPPMHHPSQMQFNYMHPQQHPQQQSQAPPPHQWPQVPNGIVGLTPVSTTEHEPKRNKARGPKLTVL